MKLLKSFVVGLVMASSSTSYAGWVGEGVIDVMYVYPGYTVVVQGATGNGGNCANNNAWSFSWGDFDALAQGRIQSVLLAAYLAQTPINVVVSDTINDCGPEGYKKFNGQIALP